MGSRGSASTRPTAARPGGGDRSNESTAVAEGRRPPGVSAAQATRWRNSVTTAQAARLAGENTSDISARGLQTLNSEDGQTFVDGAIRIEQLLRRKSLTERERALLQKALADRKAEIRKAWRQ